MEEEMSFWDHLDALRSVLFKSIAVVFIFAIAFFLVMPSIFDSVILAPCYSDFYLYSWLCKINEYVAILPDFCSQSFRVDVININMAAQFFTHMSISFWLGIVFAFPVIIYELWTFISPALYENEKKNVRWAFLFGNIMFFAGVAVGYFVVFPLTLRFLAGYQLSEAITNQINLSSYMDTFLMLVLVMGIVFELPLLCWMLSGMGLITRSFFSKYRRYAIVVILVAAAIITPSSDPFTLMVVFLPLYILYEFSALIVKPDEPEESDELAV